MQFMLVDGNSMLPNLHHGDVLMVEKITPRLGKIKAGDIVTVKGVDVGMQKKRIIKRVIALANDTVEIKQGKVYVNDKPLNEDYILGNETRAVNPIFSKVTVPEGHIYVLGDNRADSKDSRSIGPVDLKMVDGKAIFRLFPLSRLGKLQQ